MKKWMSLLGLVAIGILSSCNKSSDPNAQLYKEVAAIDNYLASVNNTEYIGYLGSSGIRMVIHSFAETPPPHKGQTVVATVNGTLLDGGTSFTTTPINGLLENITPEGLLYAIASLPAGSVATLYIPSPSGFGKTGATNVPPNSTLVYDINLQEVHRTDAEQTQFVADTTSISQYISDNSIAATKHPSGIWYIKNSNGSNSNQPKPYDGITFHYNGKLMSNDFTFSESDLTSIVYGLVDGLKIGIPLMTEGSEYTFYIPSGLGYGTSTSASIPANSNLIFDIKLASISQ